MALDQLLCLCRDERAETSKYLDDCISSSSDDILSSNSISPPYDTANCCRLEAFA